MNFSLFKFVFDEILLKCKYILILVSIVASILNIFLITINVTLSFQSWENMKFGYTP